MVTSISYDSLRLPVREEESRVDSAGKLIGKASIVNSNYDAKTGLLIRPEKIHGLSNAYVYNERKLLAEISQVMDFDDHQISMGSQFEYFLYE